MNGPNWAQKYSSSINGGGVDDGGGSTLAQKFELDHRITAVINIKIVGRARNFGWRARWWHQVSQSLAS